jgi:hypothetical protein
MAELGRTQTIGILILSMIQVFKIKLALPLFFSYMSQAKMRHFRFLLGASREKTTADFSYHEGTYRKFIKTLIYTFVSSSLKTPVSNFISSCTADLAESSSGVAVSGAAISCCIFSIRDLHNEMALPQ